MGPVKSLTLRDSSNSLPAIVVAALSCIAATFLVTASPLGWEAKTGGFLVIMAAFLGVCLCLRVTEARPALSAAAATNEDLARLDDSIGFIAGSLTIDDTFGLIASHLAAILPVRGCALYLLDRRQRTLELRAAWGAPGIFNGAGQTHDACLDGRVIQNRAGSVAIPLTNGNEEIGVMEMQFDGLETPASEHFFEGVAARVSPLISRSMVYERNVTNALTDTTTELPNERALYMILENQVAEAQRRIGERPLTLLAMDIRGFDEINARFGHAAGDRVLALVAGSVRENLRQMDFLARCNDDEFLAVLPTASKEVSQEIIARITTALFGRKMSVGDSDQIEAELNLGWASFGDDGETAEQLIAAARLRKDQKKTSDRGKILWFSQDLTR